MFVKFEIAEELANSLNSDFLAIDRHLNELLTVAKEHVSESEFDQLRRAVGEILGVLFVDVMKNVYANHPELKPPGMP